MTPADDDLARLAGVERLLIGLDYDGTIAPIVADPRDAVPHDPSVAALVELSRLPNTTCAVISGRERAVLVELSGLGSPVLLVGCHGADGGDERSLPRPSDLAPLRQCAASIALTHPGVTVEEKPTGVAVHYRQVSPELRDAVRSEIERALHDMGPTVASVLHGKFVVEAGVVPLDKGAALERLRRLSGADAVVFIGDDLTDELAFARLGPDDLGVKVGDEATVAASRIDGVEDVGRLLHMLLQYRMAAAALSGVRR